MRGHCSGRYQILLLDNIRCDRSFVAVELPLEKRQNRGCGFPCTGLRQVNEVTGKDRRGSLFLNLGGGRYNHRQQCRRLTSGATENF